jgi:hypothetical protein
MVRLIFIASVLCVAVSAQDHDPKSTTNEFWLDHGEIYNLPMMDENGSLRIQQTKFYGARTGLIANHVRDRNGKGLPHVHFRDDYQGTEAADRYWDSKFDVPRSATRVSSATVQINEPARALGTFGRGIYRYWIDDEAALMQAVQLEAGITVPPMTDSNLPADNPPQNVVVATSPDSASPPAKTSVMGGLTWKTGPSGVYQAAAYLYSPKEFKEVVVP